MSVRLVGTIALLALLSGLFVRPALGQGRDEAPSAPAGYSVTRQDGWWFAAPRGSAGAEPWFVDLVTERLAAMRRRLGRTAADPGADGAGAWPLVVRTPDRGEFRRVTVELGGGDPDEWVTALAFPTRRIVVLDAARLSALPLARGGVIVHELAHVVLGEGGPHVPRWYHEGAAQWLAGEPLERQWVDLLAYLAAKDGLIPFSDLGRFLDESQRETSVLYAQSHHFVLEMNARHGAAVHAAILARLAAGEPFPAAFRAATGEDLATAEAGWTEALAARHRWWPFLLRGLTLFQVLAVAVVIAYFVVRRRRKRALAALPEDEPPGPDGS